MGRSGQENLCRSFFDSKPAKISIEPGNFFPHAANFAAWKMAGCTFCPEAISSSVANRKLASG